MVGPSIVVAVAARRSGQTTTVATIDETVVGNGWEEAS
jgi:hypothetical protein